MLFLSISYCEIFSCHVLTKVSNQNDTLATQEKEADEKHPIENKAADFEKVPSSEITEEHLKHFSLITTIIEKTGAEETIIIDEILQTAEDNVFRPLFLYRLIKKRENERRERRQKLKLLKSGRVSRSDEDEYLFKWYPYLYLIADKNSD